MWKTIGFGKYFVNTFIVMIGSVLCAVVFNGLLAYAVSIVKPAGYKIVYGMIMASYMIPAVASLVPLYANIVSLKLESYAIFVPLCLLYGANAYYFMMFKTILTPFRALCSNRQKSMVQTLFKYSSKWFCLCLNLSSAW